MLLQFFFHKILAKYSPKRTIFKTFLGGTCPEPSLQTRILNPHPPPPPRNEILDTSLLLAFSMLSSGNNMESLASTVLQDQGRQTGGGGVGGVSTPPEFWIGG